MLIELHYGDARVLLVNGDCQTIHFMDYIRHQCRVSPTTKIDLCLLTTGEPLQLSSSPNKIALNERRRFPFHSHCVLTRVEDDGTYVPLLNDPTLITNDFLAKLRRATNTKNVPTKAAIKSTKSTAKLSAEKPKRRRSLKTVAILATIVNSFKP